MPSAYKSKGKGRDARQSRSRNTTPSNASGVPAVAIQAPPGYLNNDVSRLIDEANTQYTDLLDLVAGPNIPDSKTLEKLVEHLKSLSHMADARGEACNAGMREMSQKRKDVVEDHELEREVGERAKLKRETEDDDELVHKGGKLKRRKERAGGKEDRPLNHGAHEISRQDGAETKVEGGMLRIISTLSLNIRSCFALHFLSQYLLQSTNLTMCSCVSSIEKIKERCVGWELVPFTPIHDVP